MPEIQIAELIGAPYTVDRAAKGTKWTQNYFIEGTNDKDEAVNALIEAANMSPVVRNGLAFLIAESVSIEDVAEDRWTASIEFSVPEYQSSSKQPKQVGECTFTFDGTGGRVKITHAYDQQKYGLFAIDHGKAIDVKDGEAQGIEVVVPALSFNISQKFEGKTITLPWLRQICLATGTVNADRFLGFEPGEVLFMGPSGSQPFAFMSDGTVNFAEREVEFKFTVSPNLTNLKIDVIEGIEKAGHDYLWIEYRKTKDSDSNAKGITARPLGVYVAQVYRRIPFSILGINDPTTNFPVSV